MNEANIEPASMRFAARLGKQGRRLLHAQCWAWGQDIKHASGNLLLKYGFERLRPPADQAGCSQYTFRFDQLTVRLWGFGVYCGQQTGMYLNRYEFVPRRVALVDAWSPKQLSPGERFFSPLLLGGFVEWACKYEMWIENELGRAYRRSVLSSFRRPTFDELDLALEWLRLSEAIGVNVHQQELDDTIAQQGGSASAIDGYGQEEAYA